MKKLILVLLFCLITSTCFASLASTTVWEARKTGDQLNGGGFDPALSGTDYSQQNTAQLTLTDVTCLLGDTTITSITGGFTDAMKGNIIYISSGTNFDVGYYEIVTYTDTNNVILDRSPCPSVAGLLGNIKVGGAVDHPYRVGADFITDSTAKIWVKKGTYTYIANPNAYVFDTRYIKIVEGYNSTRGDRPTTLTIMPIFDGNGSADTCIYDNGNGSIVTNCVAINSTNEGIYSTIIINCVSHDNADIGLDGLYIVGCLAYDNLGSGIYVGQIVLNSIAYGNDNGIFGGNSIVNCIAYNNTTYGFRTDGNYLHVINCIAYSNPGIGFYSTDIKFFDYNCYYGNGTNLSGITAGSHDVNADPLFTDPTGTPPDFTLQSSSPCIGVGNPGMMPGVVQTSYKYNIGVDQSDHSTGGTTTDIFGGIF